MFGERSKRNVDADNTRDRIIFIIVWSDCRDKDLFGIEVFICLGKSLFSNCLGFVVPRAFVWIDLSRGIARRPADVPAAFRTVNDVKHILIVCAETKHALVKLLRSARIFGEEVCRGLSDTPFFVQPAVQHFALDGQRRLDLAGDAIFERAFRLEITDATNRNDKYRHENSRQQKFLFDPHNIFLPSKNMESLYQSPPTLSRSFFILYNSRGLIKPLCIFRENLPRYL